MAKRGRLALMGTLALEELQQEARLERALARFTADDDLPHAPEADPMASAQSRRAAVS
jgi:hypothetical protein